MPPRSLDHEVRVMVDERTRDAIRDEAERRRVPVAVVLREALRKYSKPPRAERMPPSEMMRLVRLLVSTGTPITPVSIGKLDGERRTRSTYQNALLAACSRGELVRTSVGVRGKPSTYTLPKPKHPWRSSAVMPKRIPGGRP